MIETILNKYINNENRGSGFLQYSTENISELLKYFGSPHLKLRTIHIAGTNGKGSTASIISDILTSSGYKTGLYTSPHLQKINERIKINGIDIFNDAFENILTEIDLAAKNNNTSLTYFDVLTAAAFIYFDLEKTDFAVIECGLGGRLDTTNIVSPVISIITDISFDHEKILGNSIEEITLEKAGIIKPNVPVITSNEDDKILSILKNSAFINNSELILSSENINFMRFTGTGFKFNFKGKNISVENIELKFVAQNRVKNTAIALSAIDMLSEMHYDMDLRKMRKSVENFTFRGRFETGSLTPAIMFDAAHNMHSITELVNNLKLYFKNSEYQFFITIMKDKHPQDIISCIKNNFNCVINYIVLNDERSFVPDDDGVCVIFRNTENDISGIVKNISQEKINIFTGSFRLYSLYKKITEQTGNQNESKIQ